MNELSPQNPEYNKVLLSYYDLVKTSILRTDKEEFIGGLPITLLRKHTFNLLQTSKLFPRYSKYTVTSKVDGTRLLMFINEPDPRDRSKRKIHFIDRSLKIYTLSNKEKYYLDSIKSPKMLLDGELLFFKDKRSYYYLDSLETEYLSFMIFDILYGPISLEILDIMRDTTPSYGSANAMAGPIGGKQWPYGRRLNILQKLILPTKENNKNPPLSIAFCNSPFFRIELKKILYISSLPIQPIYDYVNKDFLDSRQVYFDFLNKKSESKTLNDKYKQSKLEFDGLIFTPIDTEYVTENWNKFMNTQYKWKPTKEQTIDFYIVNTGKTEKIKGQIRMFKVVELYILSRGSLQLFEYEGVSTGLIDSKFSINDGVIAEFGYSPNIKRFVFNRIRLDKNKPNAFRTAQTVKESIMKPVDINLLPKLYNGEDIIETAQDYLTPIQLNRLLMCTGNLKLFTDDTIKLFDEMIKLSDRTKEAELEIRIGKIRGKYFNTNVSIDKFIDTNKLFDNLKWNHQVVNYVDTNNADIRTRYQFIPTIGKLVKLNSIKKESISKIDVDLNFVSSFDIRISTALEVNNDKTVTFEDANRITEKKRISYYDPNGIIRVDLTEVNLVTFENGTITRRGKTDYQIEFEILKNEMTSVINFLKYYIDQIETTWD
jgi:hypothetical protein